MGSIESFNSIHTPYEKYLFLDDYREFFGELKNEDILGEGNYGIVIAGPGREKVYKIGKTIEASQELENEYKNHISFYLGIGENGNKGNISIPFVAIEPKKIRNKNGDKLIIYEMERISGISILRHDLLKQYTKELEGFDHLSDTKLLNRLRKNGTLSETEYLLFYSNGLRILTENFPDLGEELRELLDNLKVNGIEHLDLHAGNIMIDTNHKDGPQIYIIDFGKATRNL